VVRAPNAVVEPIHSKAMPVILTTDGEREVWMRAPWKRKSCNVYCWTMRSRWWRQGQRRPDCGL